MNLQDVLNPPRKLPGWTDKGLFDTPKGAVRLVQNEKTGTVMQLTMNGSLRGVAPSVSALIHGAPQSGDYAAYTSSFAPASFDACAKLIRSSDGPVQSAARAVLVDGVSQADAARRFDVHAQSLSRTVGAFRKAMELAVIAVQGG